MKVVIDGTEYMPVAEVPAAAELCTRIAETWWGEDSAEAREPRTWRYLGVRIDDSGEADTTVEQFVAEILKART